MVLNKLKCVKLNILRNDLIEKHDKNRNFVLACVDKQKVAEGFEVVQTKFLLTRNFIYLKFT